MANQRGSILIYSVLMLGVILTITFALGNILLPKLRTATNEVNSTAALYAGDSALEWCLYVNRKNPVPSATPMLPLSNGATATVYQGTTATLATCHEATLNHRAVGNFRGISRSFIIEE
ncbi:MAG: hypothetical protein HYT64_00545 [Candidatus Yanofskybacteria bacterium]|nr:hypothetical protein [Candidatus Yanofskybacteria bacterium]